MFWTKFYQWTSVPAEKCPSLFIEKVEDLARLSKNLRCHSTRKSRFSSLSRNFLWHKLNHTDWSLRNPHQFHKFNHGKIYTFELRSTKLAYFGSSAPNKVDPRSRQSQVRPRAKLFWLPPTNYMLLILLPVWSLISIKYHSFQPSNPGILNVEFGNVSVSELVGMLPAR